MTWIADQTPLLSQCDVNLKQVLEEIIQVITYIRMALQKGGEDSHALLLASACMSLFFQLV